ncbi:MAG: hypothetical protein BAJATHORv1_20140 [Candidatus Thorarchaeota archaeon]|nr:MAG: hypothetical protein BAJATHORv1_20140 [Candidatus Thorarchaeota archaeon]
MRMSYVLSWMASGVQVGSRIPMQFNAKALSQYILVVVLMSLYLVLASHVDHHPTDQVCGFNKYGSYCV